MNCPNCNSLIDDNSQVCPVCGYMLYPQQDFNGQYNNMQGNPQDNLQYDNNGNIIQGYPQGDFQYDNSQGYPNQQMYNGVTENQPQKKGKGGLIAIIVVVLVAALGVGAYFMLGNKNDNNSTSGAGNVKTTTAITTITTTPAVTETTEISTTVVTTEATTTSAETTQKPTEAPTEKPTEALNNSIADMSGVYNGGIENPREGMTLIMDGNNFNIKVHGSGGAQISYNLIASGTLSTEGDSSYWMGTGFSYTIEYQNDPYWGEHTAIYSGYNESCYLRLVPENNAIIWGTTSDNVTFFKSDYEMEPFIGTVNIDSGVLNVRDNDYNGNIITTLNNGDKVKILSYADNNDSWYIVLFGNTIGYVSSEFITTDFK